MERKEWWKEPVRVMRYGWSSDLARTKDADLHALATSRRRLPLRLEVDTSEAKLQLSAEVAFPLGRRDMDFSLSLEGRRLDDLDQLLLLSLPPWGPYAANGHLKVAPDGYHLFDLDLRVGGSDLIGRVDLLTQGPKPRLEADLTSKSIQLDDFRLGDWTPTGDPDAPEQATDDVSSASSFMRQRPYVDEPRRTAQPRRCPTSTASARSS